jgi:hypothetical protein
MTRGNNRTPKRPFGVKGMCRLSKCPLWAATGDIGPRGQAAQTPRPPRENTSPRRAGGVHPNPRGSVGASPDAINRK